MKVVLPKIFLTLFVLLFALNQVNACEIISFNFPERLCLDKAGNYRGNGLKEAGCGTGTFQNIEVISGPGNHERTFTTDEKNEALISFDEIGMYTIRYTFRDETSCGTSECFEDVQTEVFYPEAFFVEESITICSLETITVDIMFSNASNVSVQGQGLINVENTGGGMGTYQTAVPVSNSLVLRIIRAQDGSCTNESVLDSLIVNVLEEPRLIAMDTLCDAANTMYQGVYKIVGGDGTYTLVSTSIGSISGDILTTNLLPSGESFNYVINSGPTCGDFSGTSSAECICTTTSGTMQVEGVQACEDDIIEVSHAVEEVHKRSSDSIIYVLHNNDQDDIGSLLDASYEPKFALPNAELADSQLYISAVVGPFTLDNLNIDEIKCKAIAVGTPVRWFSNDEFSISGKLEVCAGEKNRMFTVSVDQEVQNDRQDLFWSTSDGSGVIIESQTNDRAFVSFPTATSSGKLYFQIDRDITSKICTSIDSIEIKVDGIEIAPDPGEIILWPGDIFASTSNGPCYQWGFIDRFANFSFELIGENSKYFYSDEKIGQGRLLDRAYFVAVFDSPNCDFSFNNCNSITFFNQDILNGLAVGVEDDFAAELTPNPSDGLLRLDISGSYKGEYHLELYSELGLRVKVFDIQKKYLRSISELDYRDVPRGIYFLRINNEVGQSQVMKIVISK